MSSPLTSEVIARFAAAHSFDLAETLATVRSMSVSQRSNVAAIYATDDLLSDSERLYADSFSIRMELREMEERSRPMPGDDEMCPYRDGDAADDWHITRANASLSCRCHRMRPASQQARH
jgi:hypothetical protein